MYLFKREWKRMSCITATAWHTELKLGWKRGFRNFATLYPCYCIPLVFSFFFLLLLPPRWFNWENQTRQPVACRTFDVVQPCLNVKRRRSHEYVDVIPITETSFKIIKLLQPNNKYIPGLSSYSRVIFN